MLSKDELERIFRAKSSAGSATSHNLRFEHLTFQAMKVHNEDRVFTHHFEHGTLFGVFDGHCGHDLSEKAVRELPPLIAQALGVAIDQAGAESDMSRAVQDAFTRVILEFDVSLLRGMDEALDEIVKEYPDWKGDDLLYPLWLEWKEGANRPAFAVEGSTMLIGFIPTTGREVWVACLGDSEAWHGRFDGAAWACTPLNEMHSASNPVEVERILKEHPLETDLILDNRVLGSLPVTRALGDHRMKAPMDRVTTLYKWARPITTLKVSTWINKHKTPPYLSSTPTFKHMSLVPGDIIFMATDGLRNAMTDWNDGDVTQLFISLAGAASGHPIQTQVQEKWEAKLGHSFMPGVQGGCSPVEWVVRNVLSGQDEVKFARELTFESPVHGAHLQDDISVLLVRV
ncbi:protein serine/threonine phosphatase 2C [Auricularia subglabra TFB-10046 SS5]|nr:protein serine/threonine phosphatase 2C [Auricularia subglabra TFB-10046 SS5]